MIKYLKLASFSDEAKVTNLCLTVLIKQNIGGFYIPVNNFRGVDI